MEKMTVDIKGPKQQKKFKDLMGKFAQKSFYVDLLEAVIREVFRSAALAVCAAVTTIITRQITTDRNPQLATPSGQQFNDNDLRRQAYGDRNTSNYQSYTPAVPTNSTFPGFGRN